MHTTRMNSRLVQVYQIRLLASSTSLKYNGDFGDECFDIKFKGVQGKDGEESELMSFGAGEMRMSMCDNRTN